MPLNFFEPGSWRSLNKRQKNILKLDAEISLILEPGSRYLFGLKVFQSDGLLHFLTLYQTEVFTFLSAVRYIKKHEYPDKEVLLSRLHEPLRNLHERLKLHLQRIVDHSYLWVVLPTEKEGDGFYSVGSSDIKVFDRYAESMKSLISALQRYKNYLDRTFNLEDSEEMKEDDASADYSINV
ncbi:MAG: hypothetical protein NTW94_02140 [Legionellales bacterium]|nr:hypothetical protein [Legionellales bacterium]